MQDILTFLGDYARCIVFQGVHMVYNAQVGCKVGGGQYILAFWVFFFLIWVGGMKEGACLLMHVSSAIVSAPEFKISGGHFLFRTG